MGALGTNGLITRFLLEDTIISSKTNPCSGSTKQKSDG